MGCDCLHKSDKIQSGYAIHVINKQASGLAFKKLLGIAELIDLLINVLGRFERIVRARHVWEATFPHLHPTMAPCISPKPHYCTEGDLILALHSCCKIHKSITFTCTPSITTQVQIASSHMPVSLLNIPPSMPKLLEST